MARRVVVDDHCEALRPVAAPRPVVVVRRRRLLDAGALRLALVVAVVELRLRVVGALLLGLLLLLRV
eukprot:12183689-Alexandrium_andersonii.AAC.1